MKLLLVNIILGVLLINTSISQTKNIDTLINVGGYNLHFNIIKGHGTPILFESGSGNNGTVWNDLLKPIAKITGTTLITYDRAGLGKSGINTLDTDIKAHGIINSIEALEIGLKKLGYDEDIILVSHSLGGFYSTLYASRHPSKVKGVVFIDAAFPSYYTESFINKMTSFLTEKVLTQIKASKIGLYYELKNAESMVEIMKKNVFPKTIPAFALLAEQPHNPFNNEEDIIRWKASHKQFINEHPNREGITVYGAKHYIFKDNPELVINTIIKAYSNTLEISQGKNLLMRNLDYVIKSNNETKKQEIAYRHSEANLNSWGYALLKEGEINKALEILKLNILLNPKSWNAYDSYAEILLKANNKEESIIMYKKSIEINPSNKNAHKIIKQFKKQ